ncbi:MAG TPA: serine hydrolase domain-containing protein [Thermoanaerobaculia bacterium]|nr:serine hydrolase domain-containing protein [Thermoanaerobaculia bacterium]
MRRWLATTGLVVAWIAVVIFAVIVRAFWFAAPVVRRGDVKSIEAHLVRRLGNAAASQRFGAAALILIDRGRIVGEHRFGVADPATGKPVDLDRTAFQLASVSKAVTAWGVLRLVQERRIGLDEPVAPRMKRWRIDDRAFPTKVTLRHLLSHTAGIDDRAGYAGFPTGQPYGVRVAWEPGTAMAYSTVTYAVLQVLLEDITQRPFDSYMRDAVLQPLGMRQSSYELDAVKPRLAPAYDRKLVPQPHQRHAAPAGVALYATPRDLARFALAFTRDNAVLTRSTMQTMLQPQPATGGTWALGHTLYASDEAGNVVTGHSGGTLPAWGAMLRVNPASGNAMVLVASGGSGSLNRLPHDWVWWETGVMTEEGKRQALYDAARPAIAAIVIGSTIVLWLRRRAWTERPRTSGRHGGVTPSFFCRKAKV